MFCDAVRMGMGRKFSAGDLQLVLLALLDERPSHGYELIKTLEERSGGFYVPSPGVIYPALTYLEETGLADVEADGAKKLYKITETGRQKVEENRSMIEETLSRLERIGEKMAQVNRFFDHDHEHRHGGRGGEDRHGGGGHGGRGGSGGRGAGGRPDSDGDDDFMRDSSDIQAARQLLRSALRMRHPWSAIEAKRISGILERAAMEILQGSEPSAKE
jgi:DNA-binding PadR family transcriptional regulator